MNPTPSQTIGPFFHDALLASGDRLDVAATGRHPIVLVGRVLDGRGDPVPDGMLELWQADEDGRYGDAWARSGTDVDGRFHFSTVRPGRVSHPSGGLQAPHVLLLVFARGLLDGLCTRAYLTDEHAPSDDPVLRAVPADRRHTLLATRDGDADGLPRYRFDVRLQGSGETVFFEV